MRIFSQFTLKHVKIFNCAVSEDAGDKYGQGWLAKNGQWCTPRYDYCLQATHVKFGCSHFYDKFDVVLDLIIYSSCSGGMFAHFKKDSSLF